MVPLLVLAALQVDSALRESQTFDEALHLTAGYRYWLTGRFSMNREHPPLQKLLSALPLLLLRPELPADPKLLEDPYEYARAFLYKGRNNADTLLFLGRLATIALTSCLVLAIAWAARRRFGAPAALLALALFALEPNIIAHGHYVTTDLAAALFFFLTVCLWLDPDTPPVWTGLSLGLALASKFSLVILLPLLPALYLLRWRGLKRLAISLGIAYLTAAVVVGLVYAPETWRMIRGRNFDAQPVTIGGITLPPHNFISGLRIVRAHDEQGHPAFLLGELSEKGWWYYFPVAFAVKSPTALLLAAALALAIGLWKLPAALHQRRVLAMWLAFLAPPAVYFAVCITSHINIGIRHLLPVYPFLYVLSAAALVKALPRRAAIGAASVILAIQMAEAAAIHPNYLTFFNTLAGGPKAGPNYLLDSNLDWGQDLKKVKVFMDNKRLPSVCLCYFGYAAPAYYGIKEEYLPKTWDKDARERVNCVGAISVTLLHDVYLKKGSYEWLRARTPMGTLGNSIYLYDLRKSR